MSMYSDNLMPSGCEVDITGVISMYALQLASGKPSALVDWNNNYTLEPDKCVLFHCGNWARSFFGGNESACATARSWPPSWARKTPMAPCPLAQPLTR